MSGRIHGWADPFTGRFGAKWDHFDTHAAYTDNKHKRNKYIKVGGNSVMYGSLQRFSRAVVVDNLHGYLLPVCEACMDAAREAYIDPSASDWDLTMYFAVHKGYGSVAMRRTKQGIVMGGGDDSQRANWDIDNQWIWAKMFLDTCQLTGLLAQDTVDVVRSINKVHVQTPSFADRWMGFVFSPAGLPSSPWTP